MKPVYMINGFLESGKSTFIKFTIQQQYFRIAGTTLLILCEEGEEEYDERLLKAAGTVVRVVDSEEDFNPTNLLAMEKEVNPERIIIEFNGMWNSKEIKLPFHWNIEQQITIVDASTFPTYYNNMRSLVAEMIRKSELIIFNRCDTVMDNLATYRRNIKAVNATADVVFENKEGEINEIFEEDLPYDVKQDSIELDDSSYGIWYLDSIDHAERYKDKKITFVGMVMKAPAFEKDVFVPGRKAMTCCADDMSFLGFICKWKDAPKLKNNDWVKVTATLSMEYYKEYKGVGPVLHAESVEQTQKPAQEIIGF